jgi:hypothetical protein
MEIVFNILVLAFIGLIAYWWANQGLLSAILHFVCVVAAGALAFATWEPISFLVLKVEPLQPYAWGIGLMLPFAIYLLILRVASDKLAPDNLNFPQAINLGLGGVFGLAAGMLTVGIAIIGMGHTHSSNQLLGIVGAARTTQSKGMPNVAVQPLWIPAHVVTARTFEFLSAGALRPTLSRGTLASEQPFLDQQALGIFRDTFAKDGRIARVAAAPGSVRIDRAILVKDGAKSYYVVDVHLEPGATTPGQGFALSASQFRLVGRKVRGDGTGRGGGIAFPVSFAQPDQGGGRATFSFDDRSHYITSPAGTQILDTTLVFEGDAFADNPPQFMQTLGLRIPFPQIAQESPTSEMVAMLAGKEEGKAMELPPGLGAIGPLDLVMDDSMLPASGDVNSLPGGMRLQDGNWLFEGEGDFEQGGFRGNKGVILKGIWSRPDTRIVRLNISRGGGSTIDLWNDTNTLREKAGEEAKLVLLDDLGRTYFPIGYMHVSGGGDKRVTIKLNRAGRFAMIGDMPQLSSSGADQLFVLYAPGVGRTIKAIRLGDQYVATADLKIDAKD